MRWSSVLAVAAAHCCGEVSSVSSPIIGIFSLPIEAYRPPGVAGAAVDIAARRERHCGKSVHCEVLPASYVKFVEAAGGRVVPISSYASDEEAEHLARSLNGILFTGGPDFPMPRAAHLVMNRSRALHEARVPGDNLPVWGTCLGFEWLLNHTAPGSLGSGFESLDVPLALDLTAAAASSRLLGRAPEYILAALTQRKLTYNNHHNGFEPSLFSSRPELSSSIEVLSTNQDSRGRRFVSVIEGRSGLPWYGVQWHPEKNAFEHGTSGGKPVDSIPHDIEAVAITQYVANFFLSEARGNAHHFEDPDEESARLIYGRPTSKDMSPFYVEVYYLSYPSLGGPATRWPSGSSAGAAPLRLAGHLVI